MQVEIFLFKKYIIGGINMSGRLFLQKNTGPNGETLYGRVSYNTDRIEQINMTREDYIDYLLRTNLEIRDHLIHEGVKLEKVNRMHPLLTYSDAEKKADDIISSYLLTDIGEVYKSVNSNNQDVLRFYEIVIRMMQPGAKYFHNDNVTCSHEFRKKYEQFLELVDSKTREFYQKGEKFQGAFCVPEEIFAIMNADNKYGVEKRKEAFGEIPSGTSTSLKIEFTIDHSELSCDEIDYYLNYHNNPDVIKKFCSSHGVIYNPDGTVNTILNLELLKELEKESSKGSPDTGECEELR